MRYRGQGFELMVPVDLERLSTDGSAGSDAGSSSTRTSQRYGTRAPIDAIEVVTYRLIARVPGSRAVLDRLQQQAPLGQPEPENGKPALRGRRPTPAPSLSAPACRLAFEIRGLAIVEEPTATTMVPPGWRATVDATGALVSGRETDA